ncbi:MAG TPA: LysR substrate-binding domain-containing protein [Telmatospirillum sp.]|nr:LysR substrate-binding domain-containing protein [Telmatospirillum sp.]
MSTPLPSVNALRAFEATARLRSMTAAAQELCVTHGAISRHIKSLEMTLGVRLLHRGSQSTDPTSEGQRLAESLSTAFSLMRSSIDQVHPGPITLSCSSSIMMYWLIPRLLHFNQAHPEIEIQFNISFGPIDFMHDKISMAIRNTTIPAPRGAIVHNLMQEWIGPVCSPDYLNSLSLKQPADLAEAHLLAVKTRPNAWKDWQEAIGFDSIALSSDKSFEHFYLQIQAAVCGLGVATVPHMLVMDDIRTGKLVAPFGFVPGPRQIVLWVAPHLSSRYDIKTLETWLSAEMAACTADLTTSRTGPEPMITLS